MNIKLLNFCSFRLLEIRSNAQMLEYRCVDMNTLTAYEQNEVKTVEICIES